MKFFIRDAVPSDCYRIAEIIRDSMGYINSPSLIKDNLIRLSHSDADKVLVAVFEDNIIGFIHAENYDCLYAPHLKNLMSFAVKPEFQSKGVGTILLNAVEEWARDTGRAGIRIISGTQRGNAHKFYIAKGYTIDKQQVNLKKYF